MSEYLTVVGMVLWTIASVLLFVGGLATIGMSLFEHSTGQFIIGAIMIVVAVFSIVGCAFVGSL